MLLALFLALIIVGLFLSIPDANCISLLTRGCGEEIISLPPNCAQTTTSPDDETAACFYSQGKQQGLKFKSWIVCNGQVDPRAPIFDLDHDPRWLPSYVQGAYQFRRTVIISPYLSTAPKRHPQSQPSLPCPFCAISRNSTASATGNSPSGRGRVASVPDFPGHRSASLCLMPLILSDMAPPRMLGICGIADPTQRLWWECL